MIFDSTYEQYFENLTIVMNSALYLKSN